MCLFPVLNQACTRKHTKYGRFQLHSIETRQKALKTQQVHKTSRSVLCTPDDTYVEIPEVFIVVQCIPHHKLIRDLKANVCKEVGHLTR